MSSLIGDALFETSIDKVRWNNWLPRKISLHTWRLANKHLPTRMNLIARGVDLHSTRCQMCNEDQETEEHIFLECKIAKDLWSPNWWRLNPPSLINIPDTISMADQLQDKTRMSKLLDVVVQSTLWILWRFRNETIFHIKKSRTYILGDKVKLFSYNCITNRGSKLYTWLSNWSDDPYNTRLNV